MANLLREAKVIIWDKQMLRDVYNCNLPFGGKVVGFGGDFKEVLLVIVRGTPEQAIEASLVKSCL